MMPSPEGLSPVENDTKNIMVDGSDVVGVIIEIFGPRDLAELNDKIADIKDETNEALASQDICSKNEALDLVRSLVLQNIRPV